MLTKYVQTALRNAKYEIFDDDSSFYGEIPACHGVFANAATPEECQEQSGQVLEEWIQFRVFNYLPLPVVEGVELRVKEFA